MLENRATHRLTICEILRQINDLCQDKKDDEIRKLIATATDMAKRMNGRLDFYADYYHKGIPWDKDMWEKNRKVYELRRLRNKKDYKYEKK